MTDQLNRRDFLIASAAVSLAAATPRTLLGEAPAVIAPKGGKPVVIASANGNVFKNGGDMTGGRFAHPRRRPLRRQRRRRGGLDLPRRSESL
jgi:hypothetical protein